MKYFDVSIEETLGVTVRIKATDVNAAVEKAREKYDNHEIVLDSNNFGGVDITGQESDDQEDDGDE